MSDLKHWQKEFAIKYDWDKVLQCPVSPTLECSLFLRGKVTAKGLEKLKQLLTSMIEIDIETCQIEEAVNVAKETEATVHADTK